jgi:hypothetical protein
MTTEQALKDIRLFLKVISKDSYSLSDFPSLIQTNWNYLKDNWDKTLRQQIINNKNTQDNRDEIEKQINKFNDFITSRKYLKRNINILEESNIIYKFFDIFEAIRINWIPLNDNDYKYISKEIKRVSGFDKSNWKEMKQLIKKSMLQIAGTSGNDDATVNEVYDLKPEDSNHKINLDDIQKTRFYLYHLRYIDFILSDKGFNNPFLIDPFALAKANTNNGNFEIDSFNAGLLAKFDYGDTLSTLSNRYYGTPDKWMQIAIANGLQPPYIDEIGESIDLTVNADKNKIFLPKVSNGTENIEKFYIQQPIYMSSDLYGQRDLRIIKKITEIPSSGNIILELEGNNDLDKYQVSDNAKIRVYKKHTTNSNYFILIPSGDIDESEMVNRGELPWFLRIKPEDEIKQKVDLYLNKDKDLDISASNDLVLSYGINNTIQALSLKFSIELGELARHPTFGFLNIIGAKNTQLQENKQKLINHISNLISNDDRFDSIVSLNIETYNTYYLIKLTVRLAGGSDRLVPVTFTLPKKQ